MLSWLDRKFPELRKKLLNPFAKDINPNYITVLAFLVAMGSGLLYYYSLLIFASVMYLLNGFLDILDGRIAKRHNRRTKFGVFLDPTLDKVSDMIVMVGISFSGFVPTSIGLLTSIAVAMASYLGTQAEAVLGQRLYAGIMGRSSRIVVISIFGLLTYFYVEALHYGVLIVLVLSVATFMQRFSISVREIRK